MKAELATLPAKPGQDNEDFAGVTPVAAVLLDGAGLSGTETQCKHGVAWYSTTLGGAILSLVSDEASPLTDVLASAITLTADAHRHTCNLDDPGTPSATVVITRVVKDDLQYLVLADSVLVIGRPGSEPLVICDDREAAIGARYRQEMDGLTNGTPEHDDARRRYVETLRSHRNRPGGFWVAAADPGAANEALTGTVPLGDISTVALLSDGASRLVDRFGLATWSQLLATLSSQGPAELVSQVRRAEKSDETGDRWPRGKTYDDATAIHLTI
ncbi:protein phosphatase 2C domain-containing protein [Actinoplanes regularis]|uniref:protein phosphatase 2C domain-containing protein n=1 Tax=Actinoplanes regularis TaxID=52697 RepID=UPI0024A057AA|nr:protein phosphatase 2C domain-containing protein [Actinoplanes regularis]GLW31876.1 hypothetical protein Areg01_48150 [Actinoplanes regularis]